jgi:hypothetical protein
MRGQIRPPALDDFAEPIERGFRQGKWRRWTRWRNEYITGGIVTESVEIKNRLAERIAYWLTDHDFLIAPKKGLVLWALEYIWEDLSPKNQLALLDGMVSAFDKIEDSTAWYIICRVIGEKLPDAVGLSALERLIQSAAGATAKSLVPSGLEQVVRHATDKSVIDRSVARLFDMYDGPDEPLASASHRSLGRLSAAGFPVNEWIAFRYPDGVPPK